MFEYDMLTPNDLWNIEILHSDGKRDMMNCWENFSSN